MRLIDADAVKQNILEVIKKQGGKSKNLIPVMELPLFIDIQQTAYSVDKVVEKLEELRKKDVCDYLYCDVCAYTDKCSGVTDQSNNLKWDKAIEIVKHGGVSDDFCELEYVDAYSYYKVGCKENIVPIQYGDYCPYCGKKIKVVE